MPFFTFFFYGPDTNPFLAVSIQAATEDAAASAFFNIWENAIVYAVEPGIHEARPPKVAVEV